MKLSVIVPCYNEVENVPKLRDELLPIITGLVGDVQSFDSHRFHSAELIFVDDGSQDGTYAQLTSCLGNYRHSQITFKFLEHERNRGLGAAMRTGFSNARGEIILTVDSDGTYPFIEIPPLLAMLTPAVDLVTASPYHPAGGVIGVPAHRLLLSKGSSFMYRVLANWKVHTYTCLFRAYRSDVVKNISFRSDGFLAGTEILVYALQRGYRVAEFPTTLHRRMYGVSKARILRTILAHLRFQVWVLVYRLRCLVGVEAKQPR